MTRRSLMFIILLAASGCASSPGDGFQRHSLSRLVAVDGSSSEFVFESRTDLVPTEADADAEAVRLRWIAEWLAVRGACASGHQIIDRRPFGPMEYNPAQADLRYLVRCSAVPVKPEPTQ